MFFLATLIAAAQLHGQSFEVASVKRLEQPAMGTSTGGGPGTSDPARWWRRNVSLASLMLQAFHVQGYAIVGPDWLRSTRYDIEARVPAGAKSDDVPAMIQRLLADRFRMTFHREQKEVPGYALVTGRNGPKLQSSSANRAPIPARDGFPALADGVAPGAISVDSAGPLQRLAAGAMSMAEFADYLAGRTESPVTDLTELKGAYDIVLYFSKSQTADTAYDLPSALREQLGLELRTRKVRVNLLVADHIEQTPSAN